MHACGSSTVTCKYPCNHQAYLYRVYRSVWIFNIHHIIYNIYMFRSCTPTCIIYAWVYIHNCNVMSDACIAFLQRIYTMLIHYTVTTVYGLPIDLCYTVLYIIGTQEGTQPNCTSFLLQIGMFILCIHMHAFQCGIHPILSMHALYV